MPLPWAPSKLLDDVDSWSFTNTANSAMAGLADMGSRLMAPVGQQVRQVVEQALPPPPPAPMPQPVAPREVAPSVPTFSLGRVEDWITPTQPRREIQMPEEAPPPAATPKGSIRSAAGTSAAPTSSDAGGFSLPPMEAFMPSMPSRPTPQAAPPAAAPAAPSAAPSSQGGAAPLGPIEGGDPQKFFATAGPYARIVEQQTGVPAKLSLAIAANETGYGQQRYMAGSNNYHGIQARAGEPGAVPYKDWRPGPGGGQEFYNAAQRSFADPLAGFQGFASFLTDNPRYAPALERYKQTGDVERLAADVHAAGYAEDPRYATKIQSIMRGIPVPTGVGEVTAPAGVAPPSAAPPAARQPTAGPAWGTYTPETLTPNQINEGRAQGLSSQQALAICGPAAAVAFARANGRNPTLSEAKELAEASGVWDVSAGMHGPASEVALLEKMGIPAQLEQGADWGRIAAEVNAGRPVIVDTPGHYYTVNGAYPDGTFELGQSAGVLKASGGRTRYRPEEIQGLGMGAPRATIYARR